MRVAIGHGGASAAEAQEFAAAAFLELLVLAVGIHPWRCPQVVERCLEEVAHRAVEAAAGHHVAVGEDGEMAVAAVASVVDGVVVQLFGNLEAAYLV